MYRTIIKATTTGVAAAALILGSAGVASAHTIHHAKSLHVKPAGEQWTHFKPLGEQWTGEQWTHVKPTGEQWTHVAR